MSRVTWTKSGEVWEEDRNAQNTWYNYESLTERDEETNHTVLNQQSKWANAKTENGSYFVWIPRYAYRITYYESETSTVPTGYYDGWGMWKAEDGTLKYSLDDGIETVVSNGKNYIVHPVFETNLTKTNQSTTGNPYGIYDMAGGRREYTAAFLDVGKTSILNSEVCGLNMTKYAKENEEYKSTKYITVYSEPGYLLKNTKMGDAYKEVYLMTNNGRAWFGDWAYPLYDAKPFNARGGHAGDGVISGLFYGGWETGEKDYITFRSTLIP